MKKNNLVDFDGWIDHSRFCKRQGEYLICEVKQVGGGTKWNCYRKKGHHDWEIFEKEMIEEVAKRTCKADLKKRNARGLKK